MNRTIRFDGESEGDRKLYELGHILLHTTRLDMSASEDNRHGELQTLWEQAGERVDDEYVVDQGEFKVMRHKLPDAGTAIELHPSQYELLEKIAAPAGSKHMASHVKRDLIDFRAVVKAAPKVEKPKAAPPAAATA